MGLLQFKPNNQPGKGGSERLRHQGEDTQQVGGFDLQTWVPSSCQVTTAVNTPDQPILCPRSYIHSPLIATTISWAPAVS